MMEGKSKIFYVSTFLSLNKEKKSTKNTCVLREKYQQNLRENQNINKKKQNVNSVF